MTRYSRLAVALAFAGVGSAHAAGDDTLVVGSLDFAFKSLELTPGRDATLSTPMISINPGLAVAYGAAYVSVGYDTTIYSEGRTHLQGDAALPATITMFRSDIVATLGYRFLDSFSLFAGWLHGETGAHTNGFRMQGGTPSFFVQDVSYVEQGPFAGMSFSHAFGNKGSIAASVAYAKLNGELSITSRYATATPATQSQVDDADVKGLSYSLIWTGTLTGSLGYRVGAKYTRYNGDNIADTEGGISEKYTSYFVGFSNYF